MARAKAPTFYPRQVPPVRHVVEMRRHFPEFTHRQAGHGVFVWHGTLQPTESSPRYAVELRLGQRGRPRVYVTAPPLIADDLHRHSDGSLCLYYPGDDTWTREQPLSEVVALAAAWLWFYEAWLLTGRWLGPEVRHDGGKR